MPGPEHAYWERAEPGSGSGAVYDDFEDKAIKNGWRVDSPPAAYPQFQDPFLEPVEVTFNAISYETRSA